MIFLFDHFTTQFTMAGRFQQKKRNSYQLFENQILNCILPKCENIFQAERIFNVLKDDKLVFLSLMILEIEKALMDSSTLVFKKNV